MRQWTEADRQRQAQLIRSWQPWDSSTGPRTAKGKEVSKMNAYKDGEYDCEAQRQSLLVRKYKLGMRLVCSKPRRILCED